MRDQAYISVAGLAARQTSSRSSPTQTRQTQEIKEIFFFFDTLFFSDFSLLSDCLRSPLTDPRTQIHITTKMPSVNVRYVYIY